MFAQLHSPSVIINSMKMSHKFQFKACKLVLASCKLGRQLVSKSIQLQSFVLGANKMELGQIKP